MGTEQSNIERDIYELQKDAARGTVAVSALLRRALLLARAKADAEFDAWIRKELDGYDPLDNAVPDYRRVPCTLHALNPYRGWLPVQFVEPKDAAQWSSRHEVQSIEGLERVAEAARNGSSILRMNLPPEAESELAQTSNLPYSGYTQFVPSTAIDSILSAVRTRLLDWTMQFSLEGHSPEEHPAGLVNMNIQAKRFQFLAALHDVVEGNRRKIVNMFEVGNGLGFDRNTTDLVVQFLVGESLVEHRTLGGGIGITHHGVREVENARATPSLPTTFFPPSGSVPAPPSVTNIVQNFGSVGSIQQAGAGATQSISQDQRQQIAQVLGQLKDAMAGASLDAATQGNIEAQVGTIEAQLKAPSPPVGLIRECLHTLRNILTTAAGQALGTALPGILEGIGAILAT